MSDTGEGKSPLRSSWVRSDSQLHAFIGINSNSVNTAQMSIWTDWFFAAAPAGAVVLPPYLFDTRAA